MIHNRVFDCASKTAYGRYKGAEGGEGGEPRRFLFIVALLRNDFPGIFQSPLFTVALVSAVSSRPFWPSRFTEGKTCAYLEQGSFVGIAIGYASRSVHLVHANCGLDSRQGALMARTRQLTVRVCRPRARFFSTNIAEISRKHLRALHLRQRKRKFRSEIERLTLRFISRLKSP